MNRKEQLIKELEEINRLEKIEQEQTRRLELINKKIYTPLATGVIRDDVWYISEYTFREISDGWYTKNNILGDPDFKKGEKVVLINTGDGKYWFHVKDDDDYLYIEEEDEGIPKSENYVCDIVDIV